MILITTVTTSTISTISVIAVMGLTAAIGVVAVVALISFLTIRELAGAKGSGTSLRIAKFLSVGIVPLVMAFFVIVAVEIGKILS